MHRYEDFYMMWNHYDPYATLNLFHFYHDSQNIRFPQVYLWVRSVKITTFGINAGLPFESRGRIKNSNGIIRNCQHL